MSGGMLRRHNAVLKSWRLLTASGVLCARDAGTQINSFTAQCGGFELTLKEQVLFTNDVKMCARKTTTKKKFFPEVWISS